MLDSVILLFVRSSCSSFALMLLTQPATRPAGAVCYVASLDQIVARTTGSVVLTTTLSHWGQASLFTGDR